MLNDLDFDISHSRKQLVLVALGAFTVVAIVLALRWQSRPPQQPPRPAALEIAVIGLRSRAASAPRAPAAGAATAVGHIRTEHLAQPSTSEPPVRAKPPPVRAAERPKKLAAPAATAPADRAPPPHREAPPDPIAPESVPARTDANPRSVLEPNPYVYK